MTDILYKYINELVKAYELSDNDRKDLYELADLEPDKLYKDKQEKGGRETP